MASYSLNQYRDYIDPSTDGGRKLIAAATFQFNSPLEADERIKLSPQNGQKFIETAQSLGGTYGWDFMAMNMPTTQTIMPPAAPGGAPAVVYGNHVNLFEVFSAGNIDSARQFGTVTWGDSSFAVGGNQIIRQFSVAGGDLTNHNPPRLTPLGRNRFRDRFHSKSMAVQLQAILSPDALRTLMLQKELFTWKSADGREVEYDGATMLAYLMSRFNPFYMADMWTEIDALKKVTLAGFDFNVTAYFDRIKEMKALIDQKDPTAYTPDAFTRDILAQLKTSGVASFNTKTEQLEIDWMMGSSQLTPVELMNKSELLYTNLEKSGQWKREHSRNDQILTLTTKVNELQVKLVNLTEHNKKLEADAARPSPSGNPGNAGKVSAINSDMKWRLQKVENGNLHCSIEKDGKTWYWCEDGHQWNGQTCGM